MDKSDTKHKEDSPPQLSRRKLLFMGKSQVPVDEHKQVPVAETALVEEPSLDLVLADHIRLSSKNGKLVNCSCFLDDPFSVPQEELDAVLENILSDAAYKDIIELKGEKTHYYYSSEKMSGNFAQMLFLLEEKDTCTTIAETVRFESKTYPRPYQVKMLQLSPYHFNEEQIEAALKVMRQRPECEDIQEVRASNNALYLFSSAFMSAGHARGLCEWLEVEQYENP